MRLQAAAAIFAISAAGCRAMFGSGSPGWGPRVVPIVQPTVDPPVRLGQERVSNNGEVAPRVRDISLDLERAIDMTATHILFRKSIGM